MNFNEMLRRTKLEIKDIEQIDGLKLIRPKLFPDIRGYFVESYNEYELGALGFSEKFKQVDSTSELLVFFFCFEQFRNIHNGGSLQYYSQIFRSYR